MEITLPYEAPQLSKATRETAAIYLACGVDTSKGDENVGAALLTYPILMASDILLYQVPDALIPPDGARVMSLTDGLSKELPWACWVKAQVHREQAQQV
ncbi:Tryptophan--tRNA ligase [Nymphaea thermarum]|nr:Tryptophan--tRNA ligase [Nymphaea thermarum]